MTKIMIAEDQQLIRESLKIILDSIEGFAVTTVVGNGEEVLQHLEIKRVDMILMDIRMPVMDGVECTRIVKEKYPNVRVLILTTFVDDEYVMKALAYGANGYILKGVSLGELKYAIETTMEGGSVLNPYVGAKMIHMMHTEKGLKMENQDHRRVNQCVRKLSAREWDIINAIAKGMSNREIAEKMIFTEGTIRNYLSIILEKLQLRDRTQLAIWYLQSGAKLRHAC